MYNLSGLLKWFKYDIQTFFLLRKIKKQYVFIYINTVALFSVSFLCRILNIKNIVHCHEYLKGSIYGKLIRLLVNFSANDVISVSKHVASYIGKNSLIIHNGIPDIKITENIQPYKGADDKINFAIVGRVMPEKGQWFLLDALNLLEKDITDKIKIHIYGDAPPTRAYLMRDLKEKILDLHLSDLIVLHGFDSDASSKIKDVDCCLIPSLMADPFPTTVLEAMRVGKVIITTSNGGAKEIILDGVNGFIIEPNDLNEFASTLRKVASLSKQQMNLMGEAARGTFLENYTVEKFQLRFNNVIRKYI
ncbi:lipopolysaccharide 1,2-N-acetylglucosaminetransferase [Pluralibacter gergoviae]|nr:lipopolysaccharide 1,2-N-acetylglucosaminetransferase [Pluralibacter gergoviae]